MKRLFKILLSLLGGAIALLLIAILLIVYVVDPNDYKPQISELVEKSTGRTLTIDGDIKLTFYPWLGLDLGKVSFGNALDFDEPEFAKIEQASIGVKLMPLLSKQIEIDTVSLDGATVTLTRKPDGSTNWDDLAGLGGDVDDKPEESTTIGNLKIEGLDLRHANIVFDDQQAGSRYAFTDVNLKTSTLVLNEPVKFQFSTGVDISGATTVSGQIDLNSQITLNLENQQYRLESLQLTAAVQGDKIPSGKQTLSLNTQLLDVDLKQQSFRLRGLVAGLMGATLSGDIQAQDFQTNPAMSGQIKLADLNLQQVIKQFNFPPLPSEELLKMIGLETQFEASTTSVSLTNLQLFVDDNQFKTPQINIDLENQTLNAESFLLQAFGVKLNGQVNVKKMLSQPTVNGKFALEPFNPRLLVKRLEQAQLLSDVTLPDDKSLPLKTAALALEAQFQVHKATKVSLKNINLRIDDNQFKTPQIKIDLENQTLNTNRFLLKAFGINLNGQVHVRQMLSQPTVNGKLALAPFNPRLLVKRLEQAQLLSGVTLPDDKSLPLKRASLQVQFQVDKANEVRLKNLHLRLDDNQLKIPQIKADLNKETLDSNRFSLKALGVSLTGNIHIKQLFSNFKAESELALAPFNPQHLLKRLGQKPLQLPAPFKLTSAALQTRVSATSEYVTLKGLQLTVDEHKFKSQQLRFDFARDRLTLDNFVLNALGLALNGNLSAKHISRGQPKLHGSLKLAAFNPRQLLERLGQPVPKTTDPTALRSLALETRLHGDLSQLYLTNLRINLDNSKLQGNFNLKNFQQPAIGFNLNLDHIDVDRYLPPEDNTNKPATGSGGGGAMPLDILRALNLNGSLFVGKLKAANIKMNKVRLDVTAEQGQIKIIPKANLYNGSYQGNLQMDTRSNQPRVNLEQSMSGVEMSPLIKDLTDNDPVSGTANFTSILSGEITTSEHLLNTLTGETKFAFVDGAVNGINFEHSISQIKALIKGEALPPPDNLGKTQFKRLRGTLKFNNGRIYNNDLSMTTPRLSVKGTGQFAMLSQDMIFNLQAVIVDTGDRNNLEVLKGFVIPIKVTGKLNSPKLRIDENVLKTALLEKAQAEATSKLKEKLEEEKQRLLEKHKDKLGEPLSDLLNNLPIDSLLNY